MMREPILQMMTDKMIPRYAFHKLFMLRQHDKNECERCVAHVEEERLIWCTRWVQDKLRYWGRGGRGTRQRFNFNPGRNTTVIRAEVYDIKAIADDNIQRGYCKRNIYIFSDCQAASKALDNCRITSRLAWDCHSSLIILYEGNQVFAVGAGTYGD
jgi:hypothetical protein